MPSFKDFAALCRALEQRRGRLEKRALVADYLTSLPDDDLPRAVAFLMGRAFPVSDPRTLSVRGLPSTLSQAEGLVMRVANRPAS